MTDKVYFISLGSLVESDINKSFSAFSKLLARYSFFPEVKLYSAFLLDRVYYHTIDDYKLGSITTTDFRSKIAYQLSIPENEEIDNAWNAMCEISVEAGAKIKKLFSIQNDLKENVAIVSITNPLHYNFVIEQVNQILHEANFPSIESNNLVDIRASFQEGTLDMAELARIAIEENKWDSEEYYLISLDQRISWGTLGIKNAEFCLASEDLSC